ARILHILEKLTARSAERIVSITDRLTEYIRGLGAAAPIDIVGNGGDHRHFNFHATASSRSELGYRPDDEVVLYSGRLEPWSGVHDIAKTIQKVCETRPSARFLFVGDGTSAQTLIEDVAKLGLERQVQFIG